MFAASEDFRNAVYEQIRQFTTRVHFTLFGTRSTYTDKVVSVNVLEEMSTINNTIPSNEVKVTLDNTAGDFSLLTYQNMQEVLASRPKIEVEFGLYLDDGSLEWIPMGTYYLTEWKTEVAAMTISLIGRDVFDMLAQVSAPIVKRAVTLRELAQLVLDNAGVTNYLFAAKLSQITVNPGLITRVDSRTALQYIGIASQSAVYQDRYGRVKIEPFSLIDMSSNYLSYCGQADGFSGMVYPATTEDYVMKNIEYSQMFAQPEISLEKSLYEVIINVYESTGTREIVYINDSIAGKNGQSFKLENPLIQTESMAAAVAEWIIKESNYNAIYKTTWRQNPILECADMILVQDGFNAKKQTRIYKQEFEFAGYLKGVTESRGGI